MEENQHLEAENKKREENERIRREREEYFESLRAWLYNARLWYCIAHGFPYFYAYHLAQQQNPQLFIASFPPDLYPQFYYPAEASEQLPPQSTTPAPPPRRRRRPTTFEFIIPPLWKRVCAELMDFCMLFALKFFLTFIFIEGFDFGSTLDFYGFETLQKTLEDSDNAYPLAYDLVVLEFVHRLIVCGFETYFLRGYTCSTPGKRFMGLMVVCVDTVTLIPDREGSEAVLATGVKPLGWRKAFLRATLKNLILGLLLPFCFTFYVFPFNRSSYDTMVKSLVVENNQEFLNYHN